MLRSDQGSEIAMINASVCDEGYQPSHAPTVFELAER
jgi:hypothetical protein